MANQRPSGETPFKPGEVGTQRSLPVSISSGARICDPLEQVITTALELKQREVKSSRLRSGSASRRGEPPVPLCGTADVNRQRKQSDAFPLLREPNSSCVSGVKKK